MIEKKLWITALAIFAAVFGFVALPFAVIEAYGLKAKKFILPIQLVVFSALLIWCLRGIMVRRKEINHKDDDKKQWIGR